MPDFTPIARRAAARYGIPSNIFASLIQHESGWNAAARSPAGAVGLGQLMPATAKGLGVDPTNPVENLDGAARYLSSQKRRFGTWRLALAAYNAGPGAVESGKWLGYGETTAYVRNVLRDAGGMAPVSPEANAATSLDRSNKPGSVPQLGNQPIDLAPVLMQQAATVGHHDFDPVANLNDLAMTVAAGPLLPGAVSAAPDAIPDYTSMSLGKIIGTPGQGTHTVGNWQSDNAWDIAIPEGTPIRADSDGVISSRIGYLGDPKDKGRFAGQRVNLVGKTNSFYYAHLSKLAVKAGQRVKKGQIIGYSGSANGVEHLHWAMKNLGGR